MVSSQQVADKVSRSYLFILGKGSPSNNVEGFKFGSIK